MFADGEGWPAIGSRELPWRPGLPDDVVPRAVRLRHAGPYRAAVVPTIADRVPVVGAGVLRAAEDAAAEVARFDTRMGAEVAPFAAVLLRTESASSSRIEQLTSGARAIAVAEIGSPSTRNAEAVVGNVAAMQAALDLSDEPTPGAVLAMHQALLGDTEPAIAGRWRDEQVWVGGTSYGPHEAEYVAPVADDVPGLVADLVRFAVRTDVAPLVLAAVAHAQFETIHPFPDGNGRTGRALVHSLLRHHGVTRAVTVPVSAGLLVDVEGYFDALTAYRHGELEPVVEAFTGGTLAAITNATQLVEQLRSVRAGWTGTVRARSDAAAWRLADLLVRQPVVDAGVVARELGIPAQNVPRALAPLETAGVVTEFTGRRRNRMWQAREVLDALDAFAARAGRRR
ncbi:Fic family protein [Klenkia taihuensis]|uniref:Fic family protein n=1 Tax=Klenkia taihuensis TaxID=1225127 RepID=A0A1I1T1V8_9ACTN|nr:Fic family protein [Klenkia taihuensis]GHE13141.1 Fic family protein [Klenkia taihuensis]SFD51038.1 Fic family protein [Klenkia taihuensis]